MARGDRQTADDYDKTFAPVAQIETTRLIFNLALQYGLDVCQADVCTAFLNSPMDIPMDIELPENIKFEGHNKYPCERTLYGLCQASSQWNKTLDEAIMGLDTRMKRHPIDPCLYYIHDKDILFFINVYVDDLIIATNDTNFVTLW